MTDVEVTARSWLSRSLGYGFGEEHWMAAVASHQSGGYDGSGSSARGDTPTSSREGFEEAVNAVSGVGFEAAPTVTDRV